ncbi:amidohydrolase [Hoeflea prorocentri]|uniref:Amidohydrolase n=1 Tax=Hoeflea prorocentri TaxID=1922333 RepID=A0A9X3UHY3_9HYPH|nr:amidohydrolase [Hoeflea prorocentri]MCY6381188.1 amidohydrolase [Hoeflea prorocentri]MDA5398988.1 amidohydrolase [Hoeflea prorocentri]
MKLNADQITRLTEIRHALHAAPELSGAEHETAEFIRSHLVSLGPDDVVTGLGGTGVAAVYDSGRPGRSVLLRCELDGLPIEEISDLAYRSTISGCGHQCGHDGHMTMLLGVAMMLQENPPNSGRVILLFQPAEETGKGARAVINDERFKSLQPDYAIALHNLPGFDLHTVLLKPGAVNCASRGIRIALTGRTAHASQPETGLSPALATARIIERLDGLSNCERLDAGFSLVTVVHCRLGEQAFGVAPADAEIWATLRTVTDDAMGTLVSSAETVAQETARHHGLALNISYDDVFSACDNDPALIVQLRESAKRLGLTIRDLDDPFRFSEDFGEFGSAGASAMFFVGAGLGQPALHNPDYDFPDDIIQTGTSMFYETTCRLLGENGR